MAVHGARVGIQQTLEMLDIFQARRAADRSVTEILHRTSFLKARVLLPTIVPIFLHNTGVDTGAAAHAGIVGKSNP
jgi:hypothetical protein